MEILRSLNAMREWRASLATDQRVGFAPTMGNLHAGHIELINVVKQQSDVVVASIFVNPMQFSGNEDLNAYPRTLEADFAMLEAAGATAVFTPTTTDMTTTTTTTNPTSSVDLGRRPDAAINDTFALETRRCYQWWLCLQTRHCYQYWFCL